MPTAAVLLSGSYVYLSDSDAGHQGSFLSDHPKTMGFGPRPVAHYRKGGTSPRLMLSYKSPALALITVFALIY